MQIPPPHLIEEEEASMRLLFYVKSVEYLMKAKRLLSSREAVHLCIHTI